MPAKVKGLFLPEPGQVVVCTALSPFEKGYTDKERGINLGEAALALEANLCDDRGYDDLHGGWVRLIVQHKSQWATYGRFRPASKAEEAVWRLTGK